MIEPFDAPLSASGHAAVMAAIRAAEARTGGEIRVVITTRPLVTPAFHALLCATLVALVVPWPLAMMTALPLPALLSIQALTFVALGALLVFTPLGTWTVPRAAVETATRAAAVDHFLSSGMRETRERTGVLILLATHHRRVEVVADEGVHAIVGHEAWGEVCAAVLGGMRQGRVADGLCDGIREAARVLATCCPPRPDDHNELSDRVIIL
ncbi:TPM domain-containing protein [Ancylobacter lacus]|uniref:TPM domain-containing protein n=1 Tax=Ancylobacter lacus TaxID=2579970 RepID=UPI001BD11138|nr:TPM domain-containing protein [Ancylobacter lacus]MBS7539093.1 TPM domain-containing protein [Ancylobacter lacus]